VHPWHLLEIPWHVRFYGDEFVFLDIKCKIYCIWGSLIYFEPKEMMEGLLTSFIYVNNFCTNSSAYGDELDGVIRIFWVSWLSREETNYSRIPKWFWMYYYCFVSNGSGPQVGLIQNKVQSLHCWFMCAVGITYSLLGYILSFVCMCEN
jgi:hypothetical protein